MLYLFSQAVGHQEWQVILASWGHPLNEQGFIICLKIRKKMVNIPEMAPREFRMSRADFHFKKQSTSQGKILPVPKSLKPHLALPALLDGQGCILEECR